jgi:DNA-binding transcriptional LysR family regulator
VNLPPGLLTKLRAFEAVGRHLSFTNAAQELWVTSTALSHHVRHLEDELGVELVTRLHRRIVLTEAGQELLSECTRGLDVLGRAVEDLQRAGRDHTLTVSVAPYFSAKWLAPRLVNFWSAHPDIELRLHHAYQPADFLLDRVDAGIGWGTGSWPDTETVRVLEGDLTAVCSPALRRQMPSTPTPEDLCRWKLLYEFSDDHWRDWFTAAGLRLPARAKTVQVDDSHALRKMALDGQGIALFFTGLLHEDLRLGQLTKPIDLQIDPGSAYYLTRPKGRPMGRQLKLFWDWLLDEVTLDPYA